MSNVEVVSHSVGPIVVVEVKRRDDLLEGGQQLASERTIEVVVVDAHLGRLGFVGVALSDLPVKQPRLDNLLMLSTKKRQLYANQFAPPVDWLAIVYRPDCYFRPHLASVLGVQFRSSSTRPDAISSAIEM